MTTDNKSYWNEIIQKWQRSGCNMTEFCRREELSIHTFKYWKYKLASSKNPAVVSQELFYEYSCAAEPPVQSGESHHSRLLEPLA